MTTVTRQPVTARIDALDKVTGAARYAADVARPGMLWARALRSPLPHARITSINTDRARSLAGVHAVLTAADLPDCRVGRAIRDMPVLAREKVRFIGEKVAVVAAESVEIAEAALTLIEVEYDELPAVFDPLAAMQAGAPLIHDPADVRARAESRQRVPDYPNGVTHLTWGATEQEVLRGMAHAVRVVEHTFRTPIQHHVYLEPHACVVELDHLGVAHIWASHKAPFLLLTYLERGIGLTREKVRLHLLPLGGDFGGKGSLMDIPLAYYLAVATGRPVKMVMTYAEEMVAGNPRHSCTLVVRSGVMADGRVVARWLRAYFASGGYAANKPIPDGALPGIRRGAVGAYHVPTMRTEAHMIYTNTVPCGHMRGPGEAQTAYAIECHTDLLAREIGMDPIELRLRNVTTEARLLENGELGPPPRSAEVVRAAAQAVDWDTPSPPGVGRGVALIEFSTNPGTYSAAIVLRQDGSVIFRTPIIENGAGQLTVFRQIVAEELGVPLEQVSIEQTTDGFDIDRGIGGSRVTRIEGKIAIQLVRRVQDHLAALVAAEFGAPKEEVCAEPGGLRLPDGRFVALAEASSLLDEELVETLAYEATDRDRAVVALAQAAEVRVDLETGQVTPLRLASAHEVGRIVDPLLFQTQIEGAVLQGLGYALMEELVLQDGRVVNVNLHEYKVPTMADTPLLSMVLLPTDPELGISPIGEGPNVGIAPALANAVVDVLGTGPLDIPLHSETIRRLAGDASR